MNPYNYQEIKILKKLYNMCILQMYTAVGHQMFTTEKELV